jgi:hypothetical protein
MCSNRKRIIFMDLNGKACIESMQLGTWEPSQHLLRDREKPKGHVSRLQLAAPCLPLTRSPTDEASINVI